MRKPLPYEGELVSIKEFAEIAGVKQSLLRYYDEIDLFKPVSRGENSYRYYALHQIQNIKLITTLQALKVPLKQIDEVLKSRTPETIIDLLGKHELALNQELHELKERHSIIHVVRGMIEEAERRTAGEISINFLDGQRLTLGPVNNYKSADENYEPAYAAYYRAVHQSGGSLSFPIGGYFDRLEDFIERPSLPERFFSLDPDGHTKTTAGYYIVSYTHGDYGKMGHLPNQLKDFVADHGLDANELGPVYQVYLLNEVSQMDPSQYLLRTAVLIPAKYGKPKP